MPIDILERRVMQALELILEAGELAERGTAYAWEVARLYDRAGKLLGIAGDVCQARSRGCWSWRLERNEEGEVVRMWIGSQGEIKEG